MLRAVIACAVACLALGVWRGLDTQSAFDGVYMGGAAFIASAGLAAVLVPALRKEMLQSPKRKGQNQ